jgi:hypothetical protein
MASRRWHAPLSTLVLGLALTTPIEARAQFGAGVGFHSFGGYGTSPFQGGPFGATGYGSVGGFGWSPYSGYGVGNGQIGRGYVSSGQLYQQAFLNARPQTTTSFQPLYSAITSLPGWYGPTHRPRRRRRSYQVSAPPRTVFDDKGTILWPSTVPKDPAVTESRKAAEAAVRAVVLESKSTGHASVRPVIDAKNKLTAFEKLALPEVRAKNAIDAADLETFISDLDKALDQLTYIY